ncbi:Cyclin, C-terminal domain-containing protein [Artemisia annua]|uniref:Cyclin, C-terminal domain-containing protein n=1 Tax=Artemisia annua TaxID=35608 RepID=A0A2U1KGW7_ARTAN|nr:Cyclin, C-terminal domain-containing protein [Artemisia annua]
MKKFRSKLPRRKRSHFSPILKSSPKPLFTAATSSIITNDVTTTTISCDSSTNNNIKQLKKRTFTVAGNAVSDEFRRITRSYTKRVMEKLVPVEVSESSSCIDLANLNAKSVHNDEVEVSECSVFPLTKVKVTEENDVVSVTSVVPYGVENSEVTSLFPVPVIDGRDNDVVSVNEGESAYVKVNDDVTGKIKFTYGNNNDSETVNMYSCSEIDFSSDFASSWYESGSQFSEMSVGDTAPSPTFMLFVSYREMFCKSEFSRRVLTGRDVNGSSERIIKSNGMFNVILKLFNEEINLLRPEDEEHEESYWMLKLRERRQLYVHDYAEEYCEMKEYGDLVVKQRLQMVHWIMEQAANKELQKETMFLGVSLLDRFLSKGYFRNKRELEIAGIACLTLATRIEENQPYNSIREKFFYVGSIRYSRSEVVAMEWLVQEVLKFQCYLPTIYNFLWFYLKAARADEDVDKIAKYLALLALLGHEQLCYWPSTVAASLVILACLAENKQSTYQQITWIYDGSNDKDLPNCVKVLNSPPNGYIVVYIYLLSPTWKLKNCNLVLLIKRIDQTLNYVTLKK